MKFWEVKKKESTIMYESTKLSWEDVKPELIIQAEAMKIELLKKQPEKLEEFQKFLQCDVDIFEFRCERWGDFLTLFVKRGRERKNSYTGENVANKIVSSINLHDSKLITLILGEAPALSYSAEYYGIYNQGWEPTIKELEFYEIYRMIIDDRDQDPMSYGYIGGGDTNRRLGVKVEGLARTSQDDKIVFEGTKLTLCVPFGLGWTIYTKIMTAIKEGAPPSAKEPTI